MVELTYFGIGLVCGLLASKKVYRWMLNDGTKDDDGKPDGFTYVGASLFAFVSIFLVMIFWPLWFIILVLRKALWNVSTGS